MILVPSGPALYIMSSLRPLPKETTGNDFVLASYPKSGNTWVRFFFAHLIANRREEKTPINFHTIENFSPAVGGRIAVSRGVGKNLGEARPIKTHYNWAHHYSRHEAVLLVRDPMKCLPAFYNYLAEAHGVSFENISSFLSSWRYGLPAWTSFHHSWRRRAGFVLRYEDLLADPHRWFGALVGYLRLPYGSAEIATALEQSSRSEMKRAEEAGDPYHDAGYTFVLGEGESRQTVALTDDLRVRISAKASALYLALQSGPVVE